VSSRLAEKRIGVGEDAINNTVQAANYSGQQLLLFVKRLLRIISNDENAGSVKQLLR